MCIDRASTIDTMGKKWKIWGYNSNILVVAGDLIHTKKLAILCNAKKRVKKLKISRRPKDFGLCTI